MEFNLIPYIRELPWDVEEYCLERDWDGTSTVIEVELRKENPLATWLKKQGYVFSSEEIRRGWGHIALMGS